MYLRGEVERSVETFQACLTRRPGDRAARAALREIRRALDQLARRDPIFALCREDLRLRLIESSGHAPASPPASHARRGGLNRDTRKR